MIETNKLIMIMGDTSMDRCISTIIFIEVVIDQIIGNVAVALEIVLGDMAHDNQRGQNS